MIGPFVKTAAERLLARGGPAHLARRRMRGRGLILAYHNVLPDGAAPGGDISLHLPRRTFAEQLDILRETCRVVPLDRILEANSSDANRCRVAITFDDAYLGAVTAGVEELAARELPATVFVAPGFPGGSSFWWDALANPDDAGVSPELRERVLMELRGEDERVRRWARGAGIRLTEPPDHSRAASEDVLRAIAENPGITLASHTWSHPNLAQLEPDELRAELERPRRWLKERFTSVIPWLSYPYGLFSPAVERAAAEAGYHGALRIEGGWLPEAPPNRFAMPRLNIPAGLSADGFRLRVSGLFGR